MLLDAPNALRVVVARRVVLIITYRATNALHAAVAKFLQHDRHLLQHVKRLWDSHVQQAVNVRRVHVDTTHVVLRICLIALVVIIMGCATPVRAATI